MSNFVMFNNAEREVWVDTSRISQIEIAPAKLTHGSVVGWRVGYWIAGEPTKRSITWMATENRTLEACEYEARELARLLMNFPDDGEPF